MNDICRSKKEQLVRALRAARPANSRQIDEYIEEAEQQDGDAYWLEFKMASELIEDFDLWLENSSPADDTFVGFLP